MFWGTHCYGIWKANVLIYARKLAFCMQIRDCRDQKQCKGRRKMKVVQSAHHREDQLQWKHHTMACWKIYRVQQQGS